MNFLKRKKILVTHPGVFHTDDLFTTAVLFILNNGRVKIVRSKDVPKNADYVYDTGGVYDKENSVFDHHQKDGPVRKEGIPYSSLGLVWKEFGEQICGSKEVSERIERTIVIPIDAEDNGLDVCRPVFENINYYGVGNIFKSEIPTWKEDSKDIDKIFEKQVKKVVELLKREIKIAKDDVEGAKIIKEAYDRSEDKKIVRLEIKLPRYLYQEVLSSFSEPIYVILPDGRGDNWKVEAIRKDAGTKESRKPFPESWRGEFDLEKLRQISGIADIVFCHKSGFLVGVSTKESAVALAEKALIA